MDCSDFVAIGGYVLFRRASSDLEGLTWLLLSSSAFSYDTYSVVREIKKRSEFDSLFFIGDDDSHVSTKNYDLNLRSSSRE